MKTNLDDVLIDSLNFVTEEIDACLNDGTVPGDPETILDADEFGNTHFARRLVRLSDLAKRLRETIDDTPADALDRARVRIETAKANIAEADLAARKTAVIPNPTFLSRAELGHSLDVSDSEIEVWINAGCPWLGNDPNPEFGRVTARFNIRNVVMWLVTNQAGKNYASGQKAA